MSLPNVKDEKRIFFRERRALHCQDVDKQILEKISCQLENLAIEKDPAAHVGIYWPLPGEVDLRPLLQSIELPFALPCCEPDNSMTYRPWRGERLLRDACLIPAPINENVISPKEMSIIFVPALSVDVFGIRLGYGKGFFDRLRSSSLWQSVPSFVVLPETCVSSDALPRDTWDVPFDGWICESGIHYCLESFDKTEISS